MNNQANDQQLPAAQQQQQVVPVTTPSQPSGSFNKEAGPVSEAPVTEYVTPSPVEQAPVIPEEAKEQGVEESPSEKIQLTQAQQALDIKPEKEEAPLVISDVQQPLTIHSLTQQQAEEKFKTSSTDESIHWLTALVLKQFAEV